MKTKPSDRVKAVAILLVAQNGMSDILHVHTNLVLAARLQFQFHERETVGGLERMIMRDRKLATSGILG